MTDGKIHSKGHRENNFIAGCIKSMGEWLLIVTNDYYAMGSWNEHQFHSTRDVGHVLREENIFRYCGVGTTAQLRHILITGIVIDAILMVLNNCIFMHATKSIELSLHTYNLTVYFACKILLNNNYSNYSRIVLFAEKLLTSNFLFV